MVLDRLIVMDDVSGLADRSENFANFWLFRKNMDWLTHTFFIEFTRQDSPLRWYLHRQKYFHRQKYLISSQDQTKPQL